MNLSRLVGQKVFMQFKIPLFLTGPGPAGPVPLSRSVDGQEVPASAPFLVAQITDADEQSVRLWYETDAAPGKRIYVDCDPSTIAFVSDVGVLTTLS
jgi:hypothetical protein